jgi:AcrR family transcriptional regulator
VAEPRFISTRDEILASARREIAHHGLEGATLRGVARHAGVDPNLIRHYFGSKANLFRQAIEVDIDPVQLTAAALRGGTQQAGRRVLALLLRYWENPRTGPASAARLSATLTSDEAASLARQQMLEQVFVPVARRASPDRPELRAALATSQALGMALMRYLVREPVLASIGPVDLCELLGDAVQHSMSGRLPGPPR